MNDAIDVNGIGKREPDPTDQIIGPDQDPLDALAEEFTERCRRGEAPSMAEYLARHPDDIDRVRRLLGAVAMMEQLRRGSRVARAMPERLGEFRILRELGRGGMGVVYEAVQESLDRHVAVKVIHHVHLDPKRLKRFQREAQAVAQLHHTNIVPIFGVGEQDGLPYYVMQMIHGRGLDAVCDRWRGDGAGEGPERWRFAAKVGVQAAEALHYAHEQGVLHRDVKPANLLVDEHETVWITDFGLAKLNGREDLTGTGDVIGTLRYLAPEALHGETDARGDVYSLGLTLYELLTLEPPFGELSPSELLRQVSEGRPTTPRRLRPSIPADLETIILKAIAREPEHRYAHAGAMADDLRRFLEDRPILARRATPFERAWRWSRRNRPLAGLTATAAASLVLAAVVGWVGYARAEARRIEAERATKRAEDNVALSLDVFGELFEALAPRDGVSTPPLGLLGRHAPHGPDVGPMGPGHDRGPGGGPPAMAKGVFVMRGSHGPGGFDGPFGPPGDRGPMRGPPDGPRTKMGGPTDVSGLLQSVLSFYDRFATQNATNPKLQGEAAWAYRKVAALYEFIGRDADAEPHLARAIGMLEDLSKQYPDDPSYRVKLVETYLMTRPWTADPSSLGRIESRLHRARELAEQIAAETPGDAEAEKDVVEALGKLGATLQRLDRLDEAEPCYRRAIDLCDGIVGRIQRPWRVRLDRVAVREALAMLLVTRGRRDDALAQMDAMIPELRALASELGTTRPVADRVEALAAIYKTLGETARSDEMAAWAEELDARPFDGGPGFGDGGPR
ncbi:MAG TPA: serine/threonine-protein kinase [Isosphaeraceae bacterium]|jgi:tRNA A-37 threonylcarbamoyl transferase component Bud32/tetratricopeptide (TPR) repeat protein|nr:serine/threonine-protein kinase [Isosphaeraceae bacterium]